MNWFRHSGNIKAGLFITGIIIAAVLLLYSQQIVNELREDNRQIVKIYAEIIAKTAADLTDTNLDFVFEEIIKKVQFPIIYSNADLEPTFYRNLPDTVLSEPELISILETMDKTNPPIPIFFTDTVNDQAIRIGNIHYGDSRLIRKLQWLPFLEIGTMALFILLGFTGFTVIRNSEKRNIWVGMARETAHQLSTPVSALMGWIEWLKSHPDKCYDILPDMEIDLGRLQKVNNRFSKMGSDSVFTSIDLYEIVEEVAIYLRRRLPSMGKDISILNEIPSNSIINGNGPLLSWAIENVVKNAIDAINRENGSINIKLADQVDQARIIITDNGKGIPKRDWKNIFRPGFSTKDIGWGLGLSLTRRIIAEIHKGTIRVVQSELNQGTKIEITIPK